jgi:DNA polymerase delta subunit 1
LVSVSDGFNVVRAAIRREQGKYPDDSPEWFALEKQQLGVKTIANSTYGSVAVQSGALACVAIGERVCSFGRFLLFQIRDDTERLFNAVVILGDTDSIAPKFPGVNVPEDLLKPVTLPSNMEDPTSPPIERPLIDHVVAHHNARMLPGIKLEIEGGFRGIVEQKKRRQTALWKFGKDEVTGERIVTNRNKPDLLLKGCDEKRRSTPPYFRRILKRFSKIMVRDEGMTLEERKAKVIEFVRGEVEKIRSGDYDFSQFIRSTYYAKQKYSNKNAIPLVVNRKRISRGFAPYPLGTRINYVVCIAQKKAKFWQRIEDARWAIENKIPLDVNYYILHHLQEPLRKRLLAVDPTMVEQMFPKDNRVYSFVREEDVLYKYVEKKKMCPVCAGNGIKTQLLGTSLVCEVCFTTLGPHAMFDLVKRAVEQSKVVYKKERRACHKCMRRKFLGDIPCDNFGCKRMAPHRIAETDLAEKEKTYEQCGLWM